MPKRLTGYIVLFFVAVCLSVGSVQAQTLPDFSTINVDNLSDQQIEVILQRANALGYSQSELFQLAQQQGLSLQQIGKLSQRISQIESARIGKADESPEADRNRVADEMPDSPPRTGTPEAIFGLSLFKNDGQLSFEPALNIPTPEDYKLGGGDEVFIDIYGESEQYYQVEINPDGNVVLENIGPIFLSGLTVKAAQNRIKQKLSKLYTGLADGSTDLSVTLGQIKTIQVSVVGQVTLPGTYMLSGFSTVFNALYSAGGVTENGTLRSIKVFRNNKLLSLVDAYDFIANGKTEPNVRLQTNDVIVVGPYTKRVTLQGAVKTPAKFELKPEETLQDLLNYAGGFREDAYTQKINLVRNQNGEKVVADVFQEQFAVFTTQTGDVYNIDQVLNRFTNRVIVKGAVYRPGNFAITEGLTVKQLVERAEGLRADAFMQRAYIVRTTEDLNTQTISFNLGDLLNGRAEDVQLQREDVLNILSANELNGEQYVEISGEVNNPGVFPYSQGMRIEDLVLMAQGYRESATGMKAEITRRISDENATDYELSDVIVTDLDRTFGQNTETELAPFDYVVIRRNPNFQTQQFVAVEGQVNYPGEYGIKDHGERISDLLERAGGINPYAYLKGATLIRRTVFYDDDTEQEKQLDDLQNLQRRLLEDPESLTEAELFLLNRVQAELALLTKDGNNNRQLSDFAKRERLQEILQRNTFLGDVQLKQSEAIGIDLEGIIAAPGSAKDLLLQEGDILIIPRKTETISLRGKLLYPTTVRYEEGRSLKHYINSAGGFDNRAKRGSTYVIYANGKVARTKRFLFFRSFPKVEPGAEIIVPARPLKPVLGPQELIGITSGLATLALLISQINFN